MEPLAIVVDGVVLVAPAIRARRFGRKLQILFGGDGTDQEAAESPSSCVWVRYRCEWS